MIEHTLSKKKLQKNKQALQNLHKLSAIVQRNFRSVGIAVPYFSDEGVGLDEYCIVKNSEGYYSIQDHNKYVFVDHINLAQTAIVIANDLCMGKMINKSLLQLDKTYGFLAFEQQVCRKAIKNAYKTNADRVEMMQLRLEQAIAKQQQIKYKIVENFKKLQNRINNLNKSGINHEHHRF
jgi:hypothetical protein